MQHRSADHPEDMGANMPNGDCFLSRRDALEGALPPAALIPTTLVQHTKAHLWSDMELFCRALGACHHSEGQSPQHVTSHAFM